MSRQWGSLCIALCVAISTSAFAYDEAITFSQDSNGAVSANISGLIRFCDADLGYFDGDPTFLITASSLAITSYIYPGECAGPINPPPPPYPYSISISLGNLQDGSYAVDWEFVYKIFLDQPPNPMPPIEHLATFNLEAGKLAIFKGDFEVPN